MTPIAERPAEVATRTVTGHWEGNLLKGAPSAREGFTKKPRHVPAPLRKTLAYDRGKEMVEHERLAHRLAILVFFADPYSPWQRGTNEHTNGLLRQYLPKSTDVSGYTQRALSVIAHRLNTRPRTYLHFAMPLEVCAQLRHYSPLALGS
jgi:IS30 family transposase